MLGDRITLRARLNGRVSGSATIVVAVLSVILVDTRLLADEPPTMDSLEPVYPVVAPLPVPSVEAPARSTEASALPLKSHASKRNKSRLHTSDVLASRKAMNLCFEPGSSFDCQAAFAAALGSSDESADVVVTVSSAADVRGPAGAEPLHFQKRAPWVRRMETLSKEGIPFIRVPRGPDKELVVGINRKGMLGFTLTQTGDH